MKISKAGAMNALISIDASRGNEPSTAIYGESCVAHHRPTQRPKRNQTGATEVGERGKRGINHNSSVLSR
jgi:hypothetical protein